MWEWGGIDGGAGGGVGGGEVCVCVCVCACVRQKQLFFGEGGNDYLYSLCLIYYKHDPSAQRSVCQGMQHMENLLNTHLGAGCVNTHADTHTHTHTHKPE